MSVNKAILIGNLGQDPEAGTTAKGKPKTTFSIATNKKWKDDQGNAQERPIWHRCVAYGRLAEVCAQYLTSGFRVYVEGEIDSGSYEKDDGSTGYYNNIVVQRVEFLSPPKSPNYGHQPYQASPPQRQEPSPYGGSNGGYSGYQGHAQRDYHNRRPTPQGNGYGYAPSVQGQTQGQVPPPPPKDDDIPF